MYLVYHMSVIYGKICQQIYQIFINRYKQWYYVYCSKYWNFFEYESQIKGNKAAPQFYPFKYSYYQISSLCYYYSHYQSNFVKFFVSKRKLYLQNTSKELHLITIIQVIYHFNFNFQNPLLQFFFQIFIVIFQGFG